MSTKKKILLSLLVGVVILTGILFYMFNQPARDVQATQTDYRYSSTAIVHEYLTDAQAADEKYLDDEGHSKIMEISGMVASISKNLNHEKVILLKSSTDKAGVRATFTQETNARTNSIKIGDEITIKGVIRSGAAYNHDLEMYENVTIDKCDIVSKINN